MLLPTLPTTLINDLKFDLLVVGTAPAREKVENKKKEE
jgi:hypothetical protein